MSVTLRSHAIQAKPFVGLWVKRSVPDILETLSWTLNANFEFLGVNILQHEGAETDFLNLENVARSEIFPWSSLDLSPNDWRNLILGSLSHPEVELSQELNDELRHKAENFLKRQTDYCSDLNMATCILGFNDYSAGENSINSMYSTLLKGVAFAVWIDLPLFGRFARNRNIDSFDYHVESNNPWKFWKKLRSLTNQQWNFCLALRLPDELNYEGIHLQRWLTEPVKCLIINIKQFRITQEPEQLASLSAIQKDVVRRFLEHGTQILLECDGISRPESYGICLSVIENLKKQIVNGGDTSQLPLQQRFWGKGYENILLDPIQPLMFDLPMEMYESFEKDPVKYVIYEEAIYKAILKLKTRRNASSSEKIIIVIAGAGRGPIVESALKAGSKAAVLDCIDLIALDKNELVYYWLKRKEETRWRGRVKVVHADMRTWIPPMGKVDLIVSELLGSFGDNELSPECLDGAQNYLKPDGIIIPQSYSSFVQPIMSSEVYRNVRNARGVTEDALFERAYVVNFQNSVRFAPPQRLFTFNHPAELNDEHTNDRNSRLEFKVMKEGCLHGFAGYFESTLYEDVTLSITPADHTRDMISWWPLFIPIRRPIPLNVGDLLVAHFYRKGNGSRVWYEWTVTAPMTLSFHNSNGRYASMGCDVKINSVI